MTKAKIPTTKAISFLLIHITFFLDAPQLEQKLPVYSVTVGTSPNSLKVQGLGTLMVRTSFLSQEYYECKIQREN